MANSTAPLRIGYHLSGNLDADSRYDVTLYPDESEPIAQVIKESEAVSRAVELKGFPANWNIETVSDSMFERNLQAKKAGCTLFRNKRIKVLLGGRRDHFPVQVYLRVMGSQPGFNFKIDFDVVDVSQSIGVIQDEDGSYGEIPLHLVNLRHLTAEEFRDKLSTIRNKLQVEMTHPPLVLGMRVALDQIINEPASSSAASITNQDSILSVHDVRGLCKLLTIGSPDAVAIASGMVSHFTNQSFPSEAELFEIGELVERTTPHESFRILNSLVSKLDDNALKDISTLRLLAKILSRYKQANYQRMVAKARQDIDIMQPADFLEGVNVTHLVRTLEILTRLLNEMHDQGNQVSLVPEMLTATIALLDIMSMRRVGQVDEEKHKEAYRSIEKFKGHRDLRIHYLANYGTQAFTLIPNDESRIGSFLRRAYLVIKGLSNADIDPTAPWKILAVLEGWPDIKEAFTFQDRQHKWFADLLAIRQVVFGSGVADDVIRLLDSLVSDPESLRQDIDIDNTFFVTGLVDLLWEILHLHQIGTANQDEQIKAKAASLLVIIHNNNEGIKDKAACSYIIEEAYRVALRRLIINRLKISATHPIPLIQTISADAVAKSGESVVGTESFIPVHQPTALFDRAVREHQPLLLALQSVRASLFQLDYQFRQERKYFIPLDAKISNSGASLPLEQHLSEFLRDANHKVLAIGGGGGSGKSLGLKMFAANLMNQYREEGYFPIFVSLPRLKDPVRKAINETLNAHGMGDVANRGALLARKTVWIFDAYDEIDLERRQAAGLNIFNTNRMDSLGDNAKVIFLYKTGGGIDPQRIFKPDDGGLQELVIQPFTPERISSYLDRYVEVRESEQANTSNRLERLLWTRDQYRSNLLQLQRTNLPEVIVNPFRLKIIAEVLPVISESLKKANANFQPDDIFRGLSKDEVDERVFSYYAAIRSLRSAKKVNAQYPLEAVHFLAYEIQVAGRMAFYNVTIVPMDMEDDPDLYARFGDLFTGMDRATNVPNRVFYQNCLEETTLQDERRGWVFLHGDYREYCEALKSELKDRKAMRKFIQDNFSQELFDSVF